jgi:hypothetical protein
MRRDVAPAPLLHGAERRPGDSLRSRAGAGLLRAGGDGAEQGGGESGEDAEARHRRNLGLKVGRLDGDKTREPM